MWDVRNDSYVHIDSSKEDVSLPKRKEVMGQKSGRGMTSRVVMACLTFWYVFESSMKQSRHCHIHICYVIHCSSRAVVEGDTFPCQ